MLWSALLYGFHYTLLDGVVAYYVLLIIRCSLYVACAAVVLVLREVECSFALILYLVDCCGMWRSGLDRKEQDRKPGSQEARNRSRPTD